MATASSKATLWRPDASFCPIRFQGQWEDAETGLYQNRFRSYDPQSRQYASSDPLAIGGGSRPQQYVKTPSKSLDPLGLQEVFYRYIPTSQVDQLMTGGGLVGTGETTMATDLGYYDASGTSYNGCLMEITTSDGTFDALSENSIAADETAADMVEQRRGCCRPDVPSSSSGWNRQNVTRFKSEEGFLNVQLGRSGALDTFNSRIQSARPIGGDC